VATSPLDAVASGKFEEVSAGSRHPARQNLDGSLHSDRDTLPPATIPATANLLPARVGLTAVDE
jgi:hypothetical protein